MAANKIVVNDETIIDLTADSVTPETLLQGATAHDASGAAIEGAVAVAPASTTEPKAAGTANAGSENAYARGDHVHPSEALIAAYGQTTGAEIAAAYTAGKLVLAKVNSIICTMTSLRNYQGRYIVTFAGLESNNSVIYAGIDLSGSWYTSTQNFAPAGATYTEDLAPDGWTTSEDGYWKTQTVGISGLKASYNIPPMVSVELPADDLGYAEYLSEEWAKISSLMIVTTGVNALTVQIPDKVETPTEKLPITISVIN